MSAMRDIVILPHAGGLGDMLLYSTLPELYARKGCNVFISSLLQPRNEEAYDLVFGQNPYVKGRSHSEPNAGAVMFQGYDFIRRAKTLGNPIKAVEACHGIEDSGNLTPRIYYKPTYLEEWVHCVVADPTSISQAISSQAFEDFARWMCRWGGWPYEKVIVLGSNHAGGNGRTTMSENPHYVMRDIYQYVDILYSCRAFLAAESGAHVLASAIRGSHSLPDVHALFTTMAYNDRIFTFPNVTYSVTGRMTPDYHQGYP